MSWQIIKENWLTPTGFMLLFGAIVWGIQLNVATMNLTASVAQQETKLAGVVTELETISDNNLKLALIVESLKEDVDEIEEDLEEHEEGSERWKQKILENEFRGGK